MTAGDMHEVFEGFRVRIVPYMPPSIALIVPGDQYPSMNDFPTSHMEQLCARLPAFCTGDGARWHPGDPIYP